MGATVPAVAPAISAASNHGTAVTRHLIPPCAMQQSSARAEIVPVITAVRTTTAAMPAEDSHGIEQESRTKLTPRAIPRRQGIEVIIQISKAQKEVRSTRQAIKPKPAIIPLGSRTHLHPDLQGTQRVTVRLQARRKVIGRAAIRARLATLQTLQTLRTRRPALPTLPMVPARTFQYLQAQASIAAQRELRISAPTPVAWEGKIQSPLLQATLRA